MYIKVTYRHYSIYVVDVKNPFSNQKPFKPTKYLANQKHRRNKYTQNPTIQIGP